MTALLDVRDLHVAYGKIEAVKGISFTVDEGEVVTLIGTNGAGKTTTLRTLSGLLHPVTGTVAFAGATIVGVPAHKIVERGLAHSPEGRHIFPRMTIEENLQLGAFLRKDSEVAKDIQKAYDLFDVLGQRRAQKAGTLSGGEQQMLAMGRALMSRPKLLMLDEPSMGLSPIMMQKIMATIQELREQGTTILLVEQNAQAALSLADRGYVLETGRIVLEGSGAGCFGMSRCGRLIWARTERVVVRFFVGRVGVRLPSGRRAPSRCGAVGFTATRWCANPPHRPPDKPQPHSRAIPPGQPQEKQ